MHSQSWPQTNIEQAFLNRAIKQRVTRSIYWGLGRVMGLCLHG